MADVPNTSTTSASSDQTRIVDKVGSFASGYYKGIFKPETCKAIQAYFDALRKMQGQPLALGGLPAPPEEHGLRLILERPGHIVVEAKRPKASGYIGIGWVNLRSASSQPEMYRCFP